MDKDLNKKDPRDQEDQNSYVDQQEVKIEQIETGIQKISIGPIDPDSNLGGIEKIKDPIVTQKCARLLRIIKSNSFIIILYIILIIVANILFKKSNDSCKLDIIFCVKWLQNNMTVFIIQIFFFTLIHLLVFFTALKYCKNIKKAKWTGLIISISNYTYKTLSSHGYSESDHSKANILVSQTMMALIFIVFYSLTITYKLWRLKHKAVQNYKEVANMDNDVPSPDVDLTSVSKNSNTGSRKLFYVWITFWITFWSLFLFYRVILSCSEVNSGLMGKNSYRETEGECKMQRGSVCWHYTFNGFFKPLYWGRMSCENVVDVLDYPHVA